MRFEICLAVLLTSLVVFAVSSSNDDGGNDQSILAAGGEILHLKHQRDKSSWNGDTNEKRSKRSLSESERATVLSLFNSQRSSIGASDMTYVGYDVALEDDLNDWTRGCNYDAAISVPNNVRWIKLSDNSSYPNYETMMRYAFSFPSIFFAVRSIYVTGAAASVNLCPTLVAEGKQHNNTYLSIYGISTKTGLFDDTVQQYTLGPACTHCPSNVTWCYNKFLCRADCSFSISECCQISNGAPTTACAKAPTSTSTTTRSSVLNNGILHGVLLFACYYFQ